MVLRLLIRAFTVGDKQEVSNTEGERNAFTFGIADTFTFFLSRATYFVSSKDFFLLITEGERT